MSKPLTRAAKELLHSEIMRIDKLKIIELRKEIDRKDKLIEQMREALISVEQNSICLSEYYLGAFDDYKDSDEIQGWPKIRWAKALESRKKVLGALAAKVPDDDMPAQ